MPSVYNGARVIDQGQLQAALRSYARTREYQRRGDLAEQAQEWRGEDRARESGYRQAATDFYAAQMKPLLEKQAMPKPAAGAAMATNNVIQALTGARFDQNGLYWQNPLRDIEKLERAAAMREAMSRMDPRDLQRAKEAFDAVLAEEVGDEAAMRLARQMQQKLREGVYFGEDVESGPDGAQFSDPDDQANAEQIEKFVEELQDPERPWSTEVVAKLGEWQRGVQKQAAEKRAMRLRRETETARAQQAIDQAMLDPQQNSEFVTAAQVELENSKDLPPEQIYRNVMERLRFGHLKDLVLQATKTRSEFDQTSLLDYVFALFGQQQPRMADTPPLPTPTPTPQASPTPAPTPSPTPRPTPKPAATGLVSPSAIPAADLKTLVDELASQLGEWEELSGEEIAQIIGSAGIDPDAALKDKAFIKRLRKRIGVLAKQRKYEQGGYRDTAASWATGGWK